MPDAGQLPQMQGGLFLTDGGIETSLIFHRGLDLPDFAAFVLLEDEKGIAELRRYFPQQVFHHPIATSVKLAESPSFGKTIFQYAPESSGARDYAALAREVIAQEPALLRPAAPPAPEVRAQEATGAPLAAAVPREPEPTKP